MDTAGEPDGPVVKGNKEAFVRSCIAYAEAERERLQSEIKQRSEQVARLASELRSASRSVDASRRRLSALQEVLTAERARFEHDFEHLLALPHVRAVEVEGCLVRVLTDAITLEHQGKRYKIGEFALALDLEHGIRVINLANTGDRSAWDHPHVQGELPCLGNLRDGFEKLLGECQIVPLTSMLIQFLESYNPETAYCAIDHWEKVS